MKEGRGDLYEYCRFGVIRGGEHRDTAANEKELGSVRR
jgi:hypothetical protein